MDPETFRWLMGAAFFAIMTLLGILWRDISTRIMTAQMSLQKINKAVALDLRGLSFRISRVEAHLNLPPLINHLSAMEMDEDTLG